MVCLCKAFTKKHFTAQETAFCAQVEAQNLAKTKTKNVRFYDLIAQQTILKTWGNVSTATNNLKCNECFSRVLPRKTDGFCSKTASQIYIQRYRIFHSISYTDFEDITFENFCTPDSKPEVNKVTSKPENQTSSSETYD